MYVLIASEFDTQLQVLQGQLLIFSCQPSLQRRGGVVGGEQTSDLKTGTFRVSHTPPSLKRHPCALEFVTTVQCVWLLRILCKVDYARLPPVTYSVRVVHITIIVV